LKLICFDCDSTLSSIEGIDELARLRGPDVFRDIEKMTDDAMNGKIRIEDVFGLRLAAIRPSASDVAAVGRRYLETIEPTAKETVGILMGMGWTPVIISGGFRQAIRPLSDFLGIPRVEAVDFYFNPDGSYKGYDVGFPTTRSGGKPEVIQRLRADMAPEKVVMVGDGSSDLETQPFVELFIGFGRYVSRKKVKRDSKAFVTSLADVPALI
jgi:phosphoserine phosphatase